MSRHYLSAGDLVLGDLPEYVLLSEGFEDQSLLQDILTGAAKRRVQLLVPRRGEKARLIELAEQNARQVLEDSALELYASDRAEEALFRLHEV